MTRRLLLAAALAALATAPAAAASFALDERATAEAARAGRQSVGRDDFDREWRVVSGAGEAVLVLTPFYRVVLAARDAAFRQAGLTTREIRRALREGEGRLVLWVTLRGARQDFARLLTPRLLAGEREIEASFVQNERSAVARNGAFVARSQYGFPTRHLAGVARVELVIRDGDGHDVRRFTLDLGTMR